jgi:hypothetical protein
MRQLIAACLALAALGGSAQANTAILFVGNSFTAGAESSAANYGTGEVHDLNPPDKDGQTVGGIPALFKVFTEQAGLDFDVTLETESGVGLDYHYRQKLPLLDRAWDVVVLQSYSTLDARRPGDPGLVVEYARKFDTAFHARNPGVKIYLNATWSCADLTYPDGTPWHGRGIEQMALDVAKGYDEARKASPGIVDVVPVGKAWSRAFAVGFAGSNPYDGIADGQVNLWASDNHHASEFGSYLEALMVFGKITGRDPLSLGQKEKAAGDFGFTPEQATALQQIAHDELAAQ